jgi:hypothetical protein
MTSDDVLLNLFLVCSPVVLDSNSDIESSSFVTLHPIAFRESVHPEVRKARPGPSVSIHARAARH